jgi:hypothetical protein
VYLSIRKNVSRKIYKSERTTQLPLSGSKESKSDSKVKRLEAKSSNHLAIFLAISCWAPVLKCTSSSSNSDPLASTTPTLGSREATRKMAARTSSTQGCCPQIATSRTARRGCLCFVSVYIVGRHNQARIKTHPKFVPIAHTTHPTSSHTLARVTPRSFIVYMSVANFKGACAPFLRYAGFSLPTDFVKYFSLV